MVWNLKDPNKLKMASYFPQIHRRLYCSTLTVSRITVHWRDISHCYSGAQQQQRTIQNTLTTSATLRMRILIMLHHYYYSSTTFHMHSHYLWWWWKYKSIFPLLFFRFISSQSSCSLAHHHHTYHHFFTILLQQHFVKQKKNVSFALGCMDFFILLFVSVGWWWCACHSHDNMIRSCWSAACINGHTQTATYPCSFLNEIITRTQNPDSRCFHQLLWYSVVQVSQAEHRGLGYSFNTHYFSLTKHFWSIYDQDREFVDELLRCRSANEAALVGWTRAPICIV